MMLYVPVTLKALLVGKQYAKDWSADLSDDFSRLSFDELGEYVRGNLTTRADLPKGIHLHWSLPDALTSGKQSDDKSEAVYPYVPNRWQITRIWTENNKINTYHWIVESDYKSSRRRQFNSGSPAWPAKENGFYYIGRSYPIDKKPSEKTTENDYLSEFTIASSGNPLNTAFYPSCRNVFGFHDDLIFNGKRLENTEITYCICGWYSNNKHDVLYNCNKQEELMALLEEMQWRISDEDTDKVTFPCKTLCHGMVCNIFWQSDKTQYLSIDNIISPEVAVANTSPEALAALLANHNVTYSNEKIIEYNGQVDERMLLHLMCGTQLDIIELDGLVRSENRIHESFFTTSPAERRFTLKSNKDSDNEDEDEDEDEQNKAILEDLLAKLNLTEKEIFTINSEAEHYKELLFDEIYLSVKINNSRHDDIDKLIEILENLYASLKVKTALSQQYADKITKFENFTLSLQSGERFWEPNNPALLLSGIRTDLSHGEDGRFENGNTMAVRIDTVKKLNLGNEIEITTDPFGLNDALYKDVIIESILFSPAFADELCADFPLYTEQIRNLQCSPYAVAKLEESTPEEAKDAMLFESLPPSKVAVSYYIDSWYPIYLEWQLLFFPDRNIIKKIPSLKSWSISSGYDYICNDVNTFSKTGLSMSGRSFLTSYTAKFLSEKLEENNLIVPDSAWIEVLSQILGNFNSQLLMHDLKLVPDVERLIEVFSEKTKYNPQKIKKLLDGFNPQYPVFNTHFAPVRAGFMSIESISIIDSFGRIKQYRPDDCYTAESMRFPLQKTPNRILLPPRILQPARITFNWDKQVVAAWVMPNFFENSLSIYTAEGEQICQLYSTMNETVIRLSPDCGGKKCHDLSSIIQDSDLLAFLNELIIGDRLKSLLKYINNLIERINTPKSGISTFAAGRPFVLARAKTAIELRNPPQKYKYIKGKGEQHNIDIEELAVPIKIGQSVNNHDGVIGVFVNKKYNEMLLSAKTNEKSDYFIGNGTFELHPRWNNLELCDLTILMDPYAELNIISAMFPVKTVHIPENVVSEQAEKLYHLFFVAPLICGKTIETPFPLVEKMKWIWLENHNGEIVEENIKKASTEAVFYDSVYYAREGWLKLSPERETEES